MSTLSLSEAVDRVRDAGLVAYPTETVYGLGADASSETAVARLRRFKERSPAQPISVLVAGASSLDELGCHVSPAARRLAEAFWPGPLSLVLPCGRRFARGVARADGALAVRCSPHPAAAALARALARARAGPLTATSLNRSGQPPARTRAGALAVCGDDPEAPRLFEGEAAAAPPDGRPSTVIELCGAEPIVHRLGALDRGAIDAALGKEPAT